MMQNDTTGTDRAATILVVDDNPDNIYILERALSNAGFHVESALSGEQGLERARRGDLDLLVLDVMMPGMDGFQVLEALRADGSAHDLPVIMITAAFDPRFTVRGMDLGANEYLTRPVHPMEMVARVRSLLRTREIERQREELRRELEAQRNLLQSIIDGMGEAVFVSDARGNLQIVNQAGVELGGLNAGSVLGSRTVEQVQLLKPDGGPVTLAERPVERARHGQKTRGIEALVVNQSTGRQTPVQVSSGPVLDSAGQIVAVVTVVSDIARLKAAERQIRELAQESAQRAQAVMETNAQLVGLTTRLQAVIDEMPEGVIVADMTAGRLTSINMVARRMLGVEDGRDVRLSDLPAVCHVRRASGEALEVADLPVWRAVHLRETIVEEVQIALPDRSPMQVLMSAAPILEQTGEAVAVLRDVTEMRELDRLKDDFFFIAAHEIKNPLTSIKGFSQMLLRRSRRTNLSSDVESSLKTIDRQCDRLARLIDRLLDVSRIQLGRFQLEPRPTELTAVLRRIVEEFEKTVASDHPILLTLPEREVVGIWDELRLEQVLTNLLSNAVKYSPAGCQIQLSLDVDPEHARVTVRDHGPGIPPESLRQIFDRFYRAPGAARSRISGLGLGLFVAREIVEAHAGEIWAESVPGQGSSFFVKLPFSDPRSDAQPCSKAEPSRSLERRS